MSTARPGRRYEVMAQRDGRWVLDCHVVTEVDALARAEELYADESIAAVRVVRGHFSRDGGSFETQILERKRGPTGQAPLRLAAAPDEEAWCDTLVDFYGPASRRAMGRLLRNFLDRYQITPTELLHNHRWYKQLDNQDSLLPGAIQRMAAIQSDMRKVDRRVRTDAIEKFANEASGKARDALASRAAPKLGTGTLAALADSVGQSVKEPAEHPFWIRYAVARALEDTNAFATKFETVMAWAVDVPPALVPLIDELTAGLMGAVSMVKDTLGNQPHLGAAFVALADLAAGRHEPTLAGAPPSFPTLAKLMSQSAMPETRSVLYERLQRELATDKPLSRDDSMTQRRQFESLIDKLTDDSGILAGGPLMVAAIAKRSRRFDIVGGMEDVRFTATDAKAQIEQLLTLEKTKLGTRQQQGIGTYMHDAINRLDGEGAELAALRTKILASSLPDPMKKALAQRVPAATPG